MDITPLRDAGLTDGEIKVYLALLELGSATTGPIVENSGIAKSIVYQILEKLLRKGLASVIIKEKTKYFQAASPSKLLEYVDVRATKLGENREKIARLLPELALKQSLAPQSEARMYFGLEGIRTAHNHLYEKLKRGEEYYYCGIPAQQPKEQHLYWQRDHVRRAKAGIKTRILFNANTDPAILANRNTYPGAQARIMSEDIVTPAMFAGFKDTTLIFVQSLQPICVEIVNQEIADSFWAYFETFWKRSKEIGKKERKKITRRRA